MAIRLKSCLSALSQSVTCFLPSLQPISFLRQQQTAKTEPDVDSISAGNKSTWALPLVFLENHAQRSQSEGSGLPRSLDEHQNVNVEEINYALSISPFTSACASLRPKVMQRPWLMPGTR